MKSGLPGWFVALVVAAIPIFIAGYGWYKADKAALDSAIEDNQTSIHEVELEVVEINVKQDYMIDMMRMAVPAAREIPKPDYETVREEVVLRQEAMK